MVDVLPRARVYQDTILVGVQTLQSYWRKKNPVVYPVIFLLGFRGCHFKVVQDFFQHFAIDMGKLNSDSPPGRSWVGFFLMCDWWLCPTRLWGCHNIHHQIYSCPKSRALQSFWCPIKIKESNVQAFVKHFREHYFNLTSPSHLNQFAATRPSSSQQSGIPPITFWSGPWMTLKWCKC